MSSRRAAAERLLAILKKLPDPARLEVLQQLERLVAAPLGAEHEHSGALTWAQVREMSTAGIEFGSHTVSHPVLSVLDDATLEHELVDSRGVIEARTGKACRILAYPIGATAPRVEAAARQAGYKLGIGYQSGTNRLDRLEPFAIRRLHVERYLSRAYFQSMLALPQVFD